MEPDTSPSSRDEIDRVIAEGEAMLRSLVAQNNRRVRNGRDRGAQLRAIADAERAGMSFVAGGNELEQVDPVGLAAELGLDGESTSR